MNGFVSTRVGMSSGLFDVRACHGILNVSHPLYRCIIALYSYETKRSYSHLLA